MATLKGSMMLLVVFVAAMATTLVEARAMEQQKQQQQHQLQQQHQDNQEFQIDHDSADWRPHLPTGFRTGFSRPIEHGLIVNKSPIAITDDEVSRKPVKNGKKNNYIKYTSEKTLSQQPHSRSKRFWLGPKQKLRSVAVPVSIFHFLGFLPLQIPGLPYHTDLPNPDRYPYQTTHDIPLRVKRRRQLFEK